MGIKGQRRTGIDEPLEQSLQFSQFVGRNIATLVRETIKETSHGWAVVTALHKHRKSSLRPDDCAVPFFLDEIQTLDPANRRAILRTARQLGFIAITAAPEAVSEVDALYFLQPQNGRLVLRNRHRINVRRSPATDN